MNPASQLRIRLQSLASAGVDWVPIGLPLPKVDRVNDVARPSETFATEPTTPIVPADDRKMALATLAKEVAACAKCPELFSTRTQTVFGVGPLSPELCFVGEAPGFDEDQQGEPFVGKAGEMLTRIITGCGFKREEVYICNTLKCRPPGNATPTTKQCDNCRPYFEQQIDLIQPKMICCLGGTAAKNLLQTSLGVYKLRGKIHQYRGIPVVVTVHPSYIIRQDGDAQRKAKTDCWEDMKIVLNELGRPLPGKSSQ